MPTAARRALLEDETQAAVRGRRFERARAAGAHVARPNEAHRTITITGHPTPPRRRPSAARQAIVARPDRVALWAFLLGLLLVLVAAVTANASPL